MKTANEIFEEMKAVFENESGHMVEDGCDMAVRMYASACQTEALYIYADWVLRQAFPQTAEGTYLDSHGISRGILRKAGEKATGELCFFLNTVAASDVSVPLGTVCMTADGICFETTESAVIAKGEMYCVVKAQAVLTGTAGNAAKRTINFMTDAPVGVNFCTNVDAFSGGEGAETDEKLRERILASYRGMSNGANVGWYREIALAVPGVGEVSVIPCAKGAGTVDVIITSKDGLPSEKLIADVQSALDAQREICVGGSVYGPETVNLNITAEVRVKAGYEQSVVLQSVENSIADMFGGGILGRKLYCAEIGDRIYHTEGVESYRLITPDFDYAAPENVLLCPGEIKVSRWE